jgi:protein SCO1/2
MSVFFGVTCRDHKGAVRNGPRTAPLWSRHVTRHVIPLIAATLLLTACPKPEPLPVIGKIAPFSLTAESGQAFQSKSLDGHAYVADFIYTSCPGPCPRMTSQMHGIDSQLRELPVQFVSFTVDPEHDTPEKLAAYAKQFQADTRRWHFLTGSRDALNQVFRYSFKLGTVDGSMVHSTRFVLVDAQGQIRGYYSSDDADELRKLVRDIRRLEKES